MAVWLVVKRKPTIDHAVAHSVMCSALLPLLTLVAPVVLDSTACPEVPESGGSETRGSCSSWLPLPTTMASSSISSSPSSFLVGGGEAREVGVEVACFFCPPPLFYFFLRLGPVSIIRMPGR